MMSVSPEIEGTAHIAARQEFIIDPSDPLRDGFRMGVYGECLGPDNAHY